MSERLTTFLKTVSDFADAECSKLEYKAQSFKDENISAYKEEAEKKNKSNIEYESHRILTSANRKISAYETEKRTALIALRTNITEKVFDGVREKLCEFTKSQNYLDFLVESAKEAKKAIGGDITVFLRSEDMRYAEKIEEICGVKAEVSDKILLGGLRAASRDGSIMADDTLDSRLEIQKTVFAEKSALKII